MSQTLLAGGRCCECGRALPVWTPPKIVAAITAWREAHGRAPRAIDFRRASLATPSSTTVAHVFGSWRKGLAAAGLRPQRVTAKTWTKRAILDALTEWRVVEGKWPDALDWGHASPRNPNRCQIYTYFRTWGDALDAAGRPPQDDPKGATA